MQFIYDCCVTAIVFTVALLRLDYFESTGAYLEITLYNVSIARTPASRCSTRAHHHLSITTE